MLSYEEKAAYCKRHGYSRFYELYWQARPGCECQCGQPSEPPHHIRTRGAGGEDMHSNLLALCVTHHRMVHNVGVLRFAEMFPPLAEKMRAAKARRR